jgi:hypothetical protein
MFMHDKKSILLQRFIGSNFMISLAFLAYVTGILNALSISLQTQK